jgi:uncharacterized membrane protein YoaK (UPF0700 family)
MFLVIVVICSVKKIVHEMMNKKSILLSVSLLSILFLWVVHQKPSNEKLNIPTGFILPAIQVVDL